MKRTKSMVSLLIMISLLLVSLIPLAEVFAIEATQATARESKQAEVVYTVTVPFDVPEEDEEVETNKPEKPEYEDLASRFLQVQPIVDQSLAEGVVTQLKKNFSRVYPTLAEVWNCGVMFDIVYTIDNTTSVAYQTSGNNKFQRKIAMNSDYFKVNRSDLGALTHELTHAMQDYKETYYSSPKTANGGNWIKEGIADYSRYMYDLQSFSLPSYSSTDSYTSSYRVTGRFYVWLNQNVDATFMEQFNEALRSEVYTQQIFVKITGHTIDELWQMYADSDHKISKLA